MSDDRYFENDPVPLFLADPLEEAEQSGIRKVLSSDAFRKAVLTLGAAATLCAVVWVVNAIVFARVTASEPGRQASRDNSGQSTQAISSSNVDQAAPAQAAPVTPPAVPLLAAPATQPAAIPAAGIPAAAPRPRQAMNCLPHSRLPSRTRATLRTRARSRANPSPEQGSGRGQGPNRGQKRSRSPGRRCLAQSIQDLGD